MNTAIERRLSLGFTPAEARAMVRDIEDAARADAFREVRAAIEDELALVSDPVGPFDSGAAAAYNWILSKLAEPGAAIADDPPDASRPLFPASVSPAEPSIEPERLGRAILAHRDALRKPGKLLWHICGQDCSDPIAAAYSERP